MTAANETGMSRALGDRAQRSLGTWCSALGRLCSSACAYSVRHLGHGPKEFRGGNRSCRNLSPPQLKTFARDTGLRHLWCRRLNPWAISHEGD